MTLLTLADLRPVSNEPRIGDLRLAEALGFTDLHKIRPLISRWKRTLERFGEVSATVAETSAKGGRPGRAFWLNEEQALFLCAKSDTPNAVAITIEMVRVFRAYRLQQRPAVEADTSGALQRYRKSLENRLSHARRQAQRHLAAAAELEAALIAPPVATPADGRGWMVVDGEMIEVDFLDWAILDGPALVLLEGKPGDPLIADLVRDADGFPGWATRHGRCERAGLINHHGALAPVRILGRVLSRRARPTQGEAA